MKKLVAAGAFVAAVFGFLILSSPNVVAIDFQAFYCSGSAVRHGEDPFRTASLEQCERVSDPEYRARLPRTTLPAPLPPYDISLFAIVSYLPFALAKGAWGALLGVTSFATAIAFSRLTALKASVVASVLCTSLFAISLSLGQIMPLFMLALCSCALALKADRLGLAGFAAAMTLVEPHLGAPVCLSLFLWRGETRLAMSLTIAALAVAGACATSVHASAEYLGTVLPLQALSEIDFDGQIGLSTILHAIGMPVAQALELGTLSFAVAGILGVWAARELSSCFRAPEYLAAVPAASVLVGGTYLHTTHLVAALPLAALLLRDTRRPTLFSAILVILTVTWTFQTPDLGGMATWFALSGATAGYVMLACGRVHTAVALAIAAAVFIALVQLNTAYAHAQQAYLALPPRAAEVVNDDFPQASWSRAVASSLATDSAAAWLMRIPTWLSLIALGACSMAYAFRFVRCSKHSPLRSQSPQLGA